MKNRQLVILFIYFIVQFSPHVYAEDLNNETGSILTSAETLFKAMQKKEYAQIWGSLSQKSRDTIVQDTYKALKPKGGNYTEARHRQRFHWRWVIVSAHTGMLF
ncbi:MAG: hypothetical protein MZU95_11495 [Desulfomicrobium escambiense]|nr:hypothetical protein [Desulfomicrobium escambiense]